MGVLTAPKPKLEPPPPEVFRLPEQRAHFMMSMLDLAGLPTLLCIRHGKVVESLPPAVLLDRLKFRGTRYVKDPQTLRG